MGYQERKRLLYLGAALFIMGNQEYSLRGLRRLLYLYGRISGYKVNEIKSTILVINMGKEIKKS